MSDDAFLFHVLEDGKWHGQAEILQRSFNERGHGLTVHSRASDLRKRGCTVECELRRNGHGRALSYYRLTLNEPAASDREAAVAGSLSAPAGQAPLPAPSTGLASPPVDGQAGALPLFECVIDESAGLRGAYNDEEAA